MAERLAGCVVEGRPLNHSFPSDAPGIQAVRTYLDPLSSLIASALQRQVSVRSHHHVPS